LAILNEAISMMKPDLQSNYGKFMVKAPVILAFQNLIGDTPLLYAIFS